MTALYGYWRSSAAYRLRIALGLKGVAYDYHAVNLLDGEQAGEEHRGRSPMGTVPVLEIDGLTLVQSIAQLEYLEETRPQPPLLPEAPAARAVTRALVQIIASDIHPLQNLSVLKHLKTAFDATQEQIEIWYRHWVRRGLEGFNALAANTAGAYSVGDSVTLADVCLAPQLYNARRIETDLTGLERLVAIEERLAALPAFAAAAPAAQPDAPADAP